MRLEGAGHALFLGGMRSRVKTWGRLFGTETARSTPVSCPIPAQIAPPPGTSSFFGHRCLPRRGAPAPFWRALPYLAAQNPCLPSHETKAGPRDQGERGPIQTRVTARLELGLRWSNRRTSRIRRRRGVDDADTTDAIRAVACIGFVVSCVLVDLQSHGFPLARKVGWLIQPFFPPAHEA